MEERVLIAYYSHSGNTELIAKDIQSVTGGTLYKIKPKKEYSKSYNVAVSHAEKEICKGYLPKLLRQEIDISSFDTVYIGTPNWCNTMAPPVRTFLIEQNLTKKKVIPFCTHGGGGVGKIPMDIKALCPESTLGECFDTFKSGGDDRLDRIRDWVNKEKEKGNYEV